MAYQRFSTVKEENTWVLVILPEEGERRKERRKKKDGTQTIMAGINIIPTRYLYIVLP